MSVSKISRDINKRKDGRDFDQIREVKVTPHIFKYSDGSVLFQLGDTSVLCSVKVEKGVPIFMRGQGKGWLTAEYALLPASSSSRSVRDSSLPRGQNGRSVEISRLIGRVFRSIVNLDTFGEFTIFIDCDVLNADGGTRCAAITGASLALLIAQSKWLETGFISTSILQDTIAAISVGAYQGQVLLDIDYSEDNTIDADYNFVMTRSGDIIEIQGTSETAPIPWEMFLSMRQIAQKGIGELCKLTDQLSGCTDKQQKKFPKKNSGFTLGDRLGKISI